MWAIAEHYKDNLETLPLLKARLEHEEEITRQVAVRAIAQHYKQDPQTLPLLKSCLEDADGEVRSSAVFAIAQHYKQDPDTLPMLKSRIHDESWQVREAAAKALGEDWSQEEGVFELLYDCACNDPFVREKEWNDNPRQTALAALLWHHKNDTRVPALLRDKAENDPDETLRTFAQRRLRRTGGC
jgi:HEAT repeat protein